MLVLTRKLGEQIVLPDSDVMVTVLGISGNRVRLGIAAPVEQRVQRREIWERSRGQEDPSDSSFGTDKPACPQPFAPRGGAATAVAPEPAADSAPQRQLADRIQQWTGGRIRGLRVEREGDQLVVYGLSDSYYAWQLAQAAVTEFRDVTAPDQPHPPVRLDLEVVWPPHPPVFSDDSLEWNADGQVR